VINNLLTNAGKFLDQDTPKIIISLKKSKTHSIEIIIEDNGVGFEDIDIENIFDKYST
jgi:signal transduction histidine kinase